MIWKFHLNRNHLYNHQLVLCSVCTNKEYILYIVTWYWIQNQDNIPDNAIQPDNLRNEPTPRYKVII